MTYPGEDEYLTELARTNWRQGQREELARTFKCRVCHKVWVQQVIDGNIWNCPWEEEHDRPTE